MIYFDSTYIAKCYLHEPESAAVRARTVAEGEICSSLLARAEIVSVFHRKLREKSAQPHEFQLLMEQFHKDCVAGLWTWLPLTQAVLDRVASEYRTLPADIFLRSADAIHLATAAEIGHAKIFTNDRGLLAAATHFGLIGETIV